MRPWSSSCSWLNERPFSSVAGNTRIGIETSPKEMAPFHMVLGMACAFRVGVGILAAAVAATSTFPPRMAGMPRRKAAGPAFSVGFPKALPAEHDGEVWWAQLDGREVRLSNLDKVFWPEEGYTKGDLLAYYFNVAEWILPYLRDRPLTMKRMPNGVTGEFFYEKDAPRHTPEWMPRCPVESVGDGSRYGPAK